VNKRSWAGDAWLRGGAQSSKSRDITERGQVCKTGLNERPYEPQRKKEATLMAKQVLRGNRSIDSATITALARYAGLNLPEDRVVAQLEFLKSQVDFLNEVDRELKLGFQLDDVFHVVPPAYVFHNPPPKS